MSDFVMQIGADLDLSKVQEQLDSIKKQKVTLDVEIKGNDDAHNLAKSIEKGLKSTKIDTSGLSNIRNGHLRSPGKCESCSR